LLLINHFFFFIPGVLLSALSRLASEYPSGIPACGSDALRFTLASYLTQNNAINMDVSKVVAIRHFGNKMWQATRYVIGAVSASETDSAPSLPPTTLWTARFGDEAVCLVFTQFTRLYL
jgi:valyl-tRNA synthetase